MRSKSEAHNLPFILQTTIIAQILEGIGTVYPFNRGKPGHGSLKQLSVSTGDQLMNRKTGEWLVCYLYGQEADVGDRCKAGMLTTELHTWCTVADHQSRSKLKRSISLLKLATRVSNTMHTAQCGPPTKFQQSANKLNRIKMLSITFTDIYNRNVFTCNQANLANK